MFTDKGTETLHTPRLTLRRFTVDDAEDMYRNWATDENVTRFLTWEPHKSLDDTRALLAEWCESYSKPFYFNWVIEYEGSAIGNISVPEFSEKHERAELGYCLSYEFWRRGFMTEAASAVIDFLFGEVGVNRIAINHCVHNPASGKVAEKCGMRHEGILREYMKASTGELSDISMWGILRSDWEKAKA